MSRQHQHQQGSQMVHAGQVLVAQVPPGDRWQEERRQARQHPLDAIPRVHLDQQVEDYFYHGERRKLAKDGAVLKQPHGRPRRFKRFLSPALAPQHLCLAEEMGC
jgi:hypothetical protein